VPDKFLLPLYSPLKLLIRNVCKFKVASEREIE
jgi:hypothetical protein